MLMNNISSGLELENKTFMGIVTGKINDTYSVMINNINHNNIRSLSLVEYRVDEKVLLLYVDDIYFIIGSYDQAHGGGEGGTSDYNKLSNQPKINHNTLTGDKTSNQLGLADEVHNHNDIYYTQEEIQSYLNAKQDLLHSGVNIKTINFEDLLGEGNIDIGQNSITCAVYTMPTYDKMNVEIVYILLGNFKVCMTRFEDTQTKTIATGNNEVYPAGLIPKVLCPDVALQTPYFAINMRINGNGQIMTANSSGKSQSYATTGRWVYIVQNANEPTQADINRGGRLVYF